MADEQDKEQKTESPTSRREDEFRRQGRIAFSRDLVGAATFMTALMMFSGFFRLMIGIIVVDLRERLGTLQPRAPVVLPVKPLLLGAVVISVCALIAMVASFAQTGLPEKLDFFKGAKQYSPRQRLSRLFGLDGWKQLGVQLVKFSLLSVVLYLVLREMWAALATTAQVPLMDNLAFAARFAWKLGLSAALTLFAIGVLDYLRLYREIQADMRMTKDELKREMKEESGNPTMKRRMRALMKALTRGDLRKAVASADVIVTNPTHFAVALKYDSKRMRAPRVVAKGVDHQALRIREMAKNARVMIVENRPLARALHAQVKVNKDIPAELYKAVAEVLAAVYRTRKRKL